MKEKLYKNRNWMHYHYVVREESTYVMARIADCTHTTIWRRLHGFDIPTRSLSEATFLAERNYLDFSSELSDLIEGELLGDGCITMSSSRSARYSHTSKYKEYLIWLSKIFASLGLEQSGKINRYWNKSYNAFYYNYTSRSYPELVPLRQKWYPNDKKIVPKNLKLNPTMARQWYIGDGCLEPTKGRPDTSFSTCDFDKASIDHLLEELGSKGFKVGHRLASNTIGMSTKSIKDFLDWIGPCPINCYSYKWDYQDNRKRARAQNI